MNKCVSLFFFLFIFLTCRAFAGTTTLTTYYPAPTAAYNTVSLATNAAVTNPAAVDCTKAANNGSVFTDSSGTLHVCMNFVSVVYPQECYNSFCSYPRAGLACTPTCKPGFYPQPVDGNCDPSDTFTTSGTTSVVSSVCCTSSVPCTSTITSCTTTTCQAQSAQCGPIANGTCPGTLDCGDCDPSFTGQLCSTGVPGFSPGGSSNQCVGAGSCTELCYIVVDGGGGPNPQGASYDDPGCAIPGDGQHITSWDGCCHCEG